MKTYAVDMTYRFDWFHFKVKAKTGDEAVKIVESAVNRLNLEDISIKKWNEVLCDNYPQILDYCVDEDDLRYGQKYPEISLGHFTVISGNYDPNSEEDYKRFETYEEFIDYLNSLNKSYEVETHRGWHVVL